MTLIQDASAETAHGKRPPRPKSDGKREQIAKAALRVLLSEGVFAATTRKIAEAAGTSVATLHYHFHDKEEILFSVMEAFLATYRANLSDKLEATTDLDARIAAIVHFICGEIRRGPQEQILLQEMSIYLLRHPRASDLARLKDEQFQALYAGALMPICGTDPAVVPRVRALANMIYTGLVGLFHQWLATQDDALFEATADNLIRAAQFLAGALELTPGQVSGRGGN